MWYPYINISSLQLHAFCFCLLQLVRVTFPQFELEDFSCTYDYLQIFDGGDSSGTLLGKYCGTTIPSEIISTGNEMYLYFVSDNIYPMSGFICTWSKFVDYVSGCFILSPVTYNHIQNIPHLLFSYSAKLLLLLAVSVR